MRTLRYNADFLHARMILVDDYTGIATANFDNRSFRLTFEVTMLFAEPAFVQDVEKMLIADFAGSPRATSTASPHLPGGFALGREPRWLMAAAQ